MKSLASLLLLGLGGLVSPSAVAAEPERFYGFAYDLDDGEHRYTEVHAQQLDNGTWRSGDIRYYSPSGQLFGQKTLDFSADPYIPRFTMQVDWKNYRESILDVGPQGLSMLRSRGGQEQRQSLARSGTMVADAGFDPLVRNNLNSLLAGQTLKFSFVVTGNLTAYEFRAVPMGETSVNGERRLGIRVEPDSWLRLVAPPIEVSYRIDDPRLREYRGLSNVPNPDTGRPYQVRIVYPLTPADDAPSPLPPLVIQPTPDAP